MIKQISDKLLEVVQTATTLQGTYDFETGKATGYPYATITLLEGSTEFADSNAGASGRNFNTYRFAVQIYQEKEAYSFGPEKAERVAIEVSDEVMQILQQNTKLDGLVLWQRPVELSTSYELRETSVRSVQIIVECVSVINSL